MSKRGLSTSSQIDLELEVKKVKPLDIKVAVELQIANRPGLGKVGKHIKLNTNHLKVATLPHTTIFHYNFVVDPSVRPPLAFKIFSTMAFQNYFGDIMPIYDGNSSIYCLSPLPFNDEGEIKEVSLEADGSHRKRTFHITIRKVDDVNLERLSNYLKGSIPFTGEIQTCVSLLNTVLNYKPRNAFAVVKRGIFPESEDRPRYLYGGLELKTGFCQSMRPGWGHMTINVDVCAAVFYPHGSMLDYAAKFLGKRNIDELRFGINDNERRNLERGMKGLKVKVIHRGEKNPKYKIERLSSKAADYTIFMNDKEGVEMNVTDYFARTYNRYLEFKSLPCIVVKKNLFIPMEVCNVLPGQKYDKMIGDRAKADMIKFTACRPQERFSQIENCIRNVFKHDDDENLRDFGINIDSKMMIIDGRILKSPTILFNANSKQQNQFTSQNGRWNLRDLVLLRTKPLHNWSVLILSDRRTSPIDQVKRCMSGLKQKLVEFGMEVRNDPYVNFGNQQGNIEASIQVAVQKAHINKSFPPQLIIVIIPRKPSPLYGEIKKVADTKIGVTMIVGADISHPGIGQKNQPSIAAVCASVEPTATTYYGRVSVNKQIRNETIECLGDMISDLLKAFYEKNKVLPKRMIFYRDGVSEGQFRGVLNREVIALKNAFNKIYQKDPPKLTFLIAQKRHHTRCSSAISVVPPIAYAHLLAARVRLYPTGESPEEKDCGESSNLSESTFSVPPVSKELAKVMYFV
ncbi:13559_t:CDS:10 [Funneliformis geosporum]|uniref:4681_t:CDS:1 n=1 Tax=Funneliformis geosporum TaxID=1117311 RepID=A0A9W4WQF2_9GLOM|nr:4681_t:CDS:10 [Funneliformis geosporum]CAI2174471.1 13559_t:CDS:10 [Funneliformis geosporum]